MYFVKAFSISLLSEEDFFRSSLINILMKRKKYFFFLQKWSTVPNVYVSTYETGGQKGVWKPVKIYILMNPIELYTTNV